MLSSNVMNCTKCQQGKARKCSIACSFDGKGKANINNDVNQIQSTLSNESIQCPDQWVCVNCEFSWCAACGFPFDSKCKVGGSKDSHNCREATNYAINCIVTNLESIYNQYTMVQVRTGVQRSKRYFPFNIIPTGIFCGLYGGKNHKNGVWGAGTGFGGHRREGKSNQRRVRKFEKELDCQTESVLKSLTSVLKNKPGNQLQPIIGFSASALLGRQNVVGQLIACLVMNDSMIDICARGALYMQLADLLEAMAQYPELLMMLKGSSSETDRKAGSSVDGNNGSDASLINKMKNIYEQSKIILNRLRDEKHGTNVEADIGIARRLFECYEKLANAAENQTSLMPSIISVCNDEHLGMTTDSKTTSDQMVSAASKEDGSNNMEDNEVSSEQFKNVSIYKESLKPLQFVEYPLLGSGVQRHIYSKYFDGSGSNKQSIDNEGVHNKTRMLHIAKEIASLATNLPLEWESSIHVRVDPVRMDLLKALIVGPNGTPYQNGVFTFDIYLPPDYPQVPPKVTFLTTGCGTVRFNPNLYINGNVCLSLLGTWFGPGWQPWKSTLLQVLVSIQSLIFVAEPFYNEPWQRENHRAAREENKNHRYNTLKYAILGALQNPDPSFKDLIIMHFQQKKDEIINQCHDWIKACGFTTHQLHAKLIKTADEVILELEKVSLVGKKHVQQ